jgi:hypothetical protein
MKFQLPDVLHKELSKTSEKIYKGRLNALAKGGFDTVDALLNNKKKVVALIKEATGDDEKQKMVARQFISAISWVVDPAKMPKNNLYHRFYQTILPGVEGWKKKKDYVEISDEE